MEFLTKMKVKLKKFGGKNLLFICKEVAVDTNTLESKKSGNHRKNKNSFLRISVAHQRAASVPSIGSTSLAYFSD